VIFAPLAGATGVASTIDNSISSEGRRSEQGMPQSIDHLSDVLLR
jgi:hypothetical protein